uniref:Protein FRA10AC1 n=1 Tax=Tetraselmis sp. GSL018 TaxID=582737 RepID=A0A061QZX0_9CHLO|mmetsp:Transcript_37604/g.89334  ORF Transcript_37604/g.89334 Transcript_37604/m.89334 type:complete len:273 (-) Transcript_37604:137-955(-)
MSSRNSLRTTAFDSVQRTEQRRSLQGLSAYERHKKFVSDYIKYYGGKLPTPAKVETKSDWDVVRENHKFLWEDDFDVGNSWEAKLAKKYYDKLFKEYCLANLTRYKEGKIGLRWRTEKEVLAGKGQFSCGNKHCSGQQGLASFEVNFGYKEGGERKQALVKLRVCPDCAAKLSYSYSGSLKRAAGQAEADSPDVAKRQKVSSPRADAGGPHGARESVCEQRGEGKSDGRQRSDKDEAPEGHSGSDAWRGDRQESSEPTQEEEFEQYFKDMFA